MVTKWFALTANVTPACIESTVLALAIKGYEVGSNEIRIVHDKVFRTTLNCNSTQPPWHPDNRVGISITPGGNQWSPAKLTDMLATIIDGFMLIENIIENEHRAYEPDNDSDLAHNIFCGYDYKAAVSRWTPLKCHRCHNMHDPDNFLWERNDECKKLTDLERILAMYEFGQTPCCRACMIYSTKCRRPTFADATKLIVYIKHIFDNQCRAKCPQCKKMHWHYVGPSNVVIPNREWGYRLCDTIGCDGYDLHPSHNVKVHATKRSFNKSIRKLK